MSRTISGMTAALGCAFVMSVSAQETTVKSKTKTEGAQPQMVMYTGCVQTGTETRTYVLDKAVPVSRTQSSETSTPTGTSMTTTTTTRYELVPDQTVQLETAVGQKVEVTGMLIPGGDSKSKSKSKIEREDAPDTTVKQKTKTEGGMPQFRVISVKSLGESCTPQQ